jgi:hypothetical protein
MSHVEGWLVAARFEDVARRGKFRCKNLAKTRDWFGRNLQLVSAPFSRFFIKTTPNYRLTGVCSFRDRLGTTISSLFSPLAQQNIAGAATVFVVPSATETHPRCA